MKQFPPLTDGSLVLRTDFSDDAAWEAICAAIRKPQTEVNFCAHVDCVSDAAFSNVSAAQLAIRNPAHTFIFIVDSVTLSKPEHPILVLDLYDQVGRTFRVIPSEMWGVENNLSLANMDFEEFADNVDADGVFCGFQT